MGNGPEIGARVTGVVLIVLLHLVLAYDVYAGMRWGSSATISEVLYEWIRAYPIIAFTLGILMGHIVWPLR